MLQRRPLGDAARAVVLQRGLIALVALMLTPLPLLAHSSGERGDAISVDVLVNLLVCVSNTSIYFSRVLKPIQLRIVGVSLYG